MKRITAEKRREKTNNTTLAAPMHLSIISSFFLPFHFPDPSIDALNLNQAKNKTCPTKKAAMSVR